MKFVALVLVFGLVACSSSGPKKEDKSTSPVAPMPHTLTSDDITQKYGLMELNAAANLLKVAVDTAGTKPTKDVGSDLIGCPLTGTEASRMAMSVKALIDKELPGESDAYTNDPRNYATEKGFETCASQCACGVLDDVVEVANESSMPQGSSRTHARNKQHLSVKAAHLNARDSQVCARKASWFCGSDLRSYLSKDSKQ